MKQGAFKSVVLAALITHATVKVTVSRYDIIVSNKLQYLIVIITRSKPGHHLASLSHHVHRTLTMLCMVLREWVGLRAFHSFLRHFNTNTLSFVFHFSDTIKECIQRRTKNLAKMAYWIFNLRSPNIPRFKQTEDSHFRLPHACIILILLQGFLYLKCQAPIHATFVDQVANRPQLSK